MAISAEALRQLHRIHRQLSDLRGRMERGPKQLRAGEANVASLDQQLVASKQALVKAKVAADDKQLQLKQRETRIADLRGKLNVANNNKEYQAIKEQIAADEQANSVLSDEILEALETIDELAAGVKTAESNLAKSKSELEKTRQRLAAEQPQLEGEIARVNDELKRVESLLPADFKNDYNRIIAARGEHALAPVEGESCGGCHQMLSPQTMNELYMAKPVFCKSCGCLLYLPEDRAVGGGKS